MKKQMLVLSAIALATASSQAYTVLDLQDTGTKVDFNGSLRLVWKSTSEKNTEADGTQTKEHINHAVTNNSSRFGFKLTQQLGAGFYGVGRVEWRFRGTSPSQHDFDDIYTRQLFAGIGNKQYGELVYGHMTTITDSVKQTDLGNTLSLSDGLLTSSARKVAQYTYSGIDGLTLGGFVGGKSKRNMKALDLDSQRKNVWGLAGIYNFKLDDVQSVKLGTGVTQERSYNNGSSGSTFNRTAYSLAGAYTFAKTTFGLDLERAETKDEGLVQKRTQQEVRTVLEQKLTDDWRVYGMYAYKTDKSDNISKVKTHQYMVGTEYFVLPKYVKVFVEGATSRAKDSVKHTKKRDNVAAIGLRAYW